MAFTAPWSSGNETAKSSSDKKDVSLDDVLPTAALRVELMLLVVMCTESMKEEIKAAFDVQKVQVEPITSPTSLLHDATYEFPLVDIEGDPKTRDQPAAHDPPLFDADGNTQTRIVPASTSKVLSNKGYIHNLALASPEFQTLETDAATYFQGWRTAVLRRLGEKLKVQPEAVRRAKARHLAESQDLLSSDILEPTTTKHEPTKPPTVTFYTRLNKLDAKTRALVLNATLFILLSLERYPAHSRILLTHIAHSLDLPDDILISAEANLALTLQQSTGTAVGNGQSQSASPPPSNRDSKWKIGLAAIAGATLIGVTGGLAAPFLLGAAGAIMGGVGLGGLATLLGATIANPVTVAALFGVLGGRMGGQAMEEFAKEVEDFEILPIDSSLSSTIDKNATDTSTKPPPPSSPSPSPSLSPRLSTTIRPQPKTHMRLTLGISGHLQTENDITRPWQVLSSSSSNTFALRYELTALLKLGESLTSALRNSAYTLAQASALQLALPALSAALLPVSLLSLGSLLDNPFSIAMERSDKAGVVLARALIAKVQGERPVSLIGFSVGARVIYSCLHELARQGAFGLVEDAVLIGAPAPSDGPAWVKMRAVTVGRLVNVYTTNDLLLGYLYRVRYAQVGVAGLEAVTGVRGLENVDVTGFVKGHGQYRLAVGRVLLRIGFEGLDLRRVEEEERALEREDRQEREVHERARKEGRLDGLEDEMGKIVMIDATEIAERDEAAGTSDVKARVLSQVTGRTAADKHMLKHNEDSDDDTDAGHDEVTQSIAMVDLDPTPMPEDDP